jgi:hypothetical protein
MSTKEYNVEQVSISQQQTRYHAPRNLRQKNKWTKEVIILHPRVFVNPVATEGKT